MPIDQHELAAAVAGLVKARSEKQWQGIRPEGSGQNDAAQNVPQNGKNAALTILQSMKLAQDRWPDATQWEIIGSDEVDQDIWEAPETFAEFTWPAADPDEAA
jgi:hypothetical protein